MTRAVEFTGRIIIESRHAVTPRRHSVTYRYGNAMKRSASNSPADYTITDSIRSWSAEKYGAQFLPDVYREDWVDAALARGSTYADCERALMNWIRWSSPSGRFYHVGDWESKLKAARSRENGKRTCKPAVQVAGVEIQPMQMTTSRDAARAALANIKGMIR